MTLYTAIVIVAGLILIDQLARHATYVWTVCLNYRLNVAHMQMHHVVDFIPVEDDFLPDDDDNGGIIN